MAYSLSPQSCSDGSQTWASVSSKDVTLPLVLREQTVRKDVVGGNTFPSDGSDKSV